MKGVKGRHFLLTIFPFKKKLLMRSCQFSIANEVFYFPALDSPGQRMPLKNNDCSWHSVWVFLMQRNGWSQE